MVKTGAAVWTGAGLAAGAPVWYGFGEGKAPAAAAAGFDAGVAGRAAAGAGVAEEHATGARISKTAAQPIIHLVIGVSLISLTFWVRVTRRLPGGDGHGGRTVKKMSHRNNDIIHDGIKHRHHHQAEQC